MNTITRGAVALAIGAIIWGLPVPDGLNPAAWKLFAVFVATIAGFILQPLPMGAIAFISITFTAGMGILKPGEVLSGFSSGTIWLIVTAFLFSRAFTKTGLGKRIAYVLIKNFGGRTLNLGYILIFSELVIAPATPSNTARGGGIMFPIANSLAAAFKTETGTDLRRMGAFLMQTGYQSNVITSAMFMTSMAANPLIVMLSAQSLNVSISWGLWATAAAIPGLLSVLVVPYYLYKAYPPELTHTPEAKVLAEKSLMAMGGMSGSEKIVACVLAGALLLWSTSHLTKIDATVVAMLAVSVMLLTHVLEWKEVLEEKGAWDTFVWMGSLVGLADFLAKNGFIAWLAKAISAQLVGIPWVPAFLLVVILYLYTHYGFASMTAHVIAMFSAFATVAAAAGVPPYLNALSLAYVSNLCASLTHYGASAGPIYFGAGYVDQKSWWKHGFVISVINLVIWLGVGSVWWKVMGLW